MIQSIPIRKLELCGLSLFCLALGLIAQPANANIAAAQRSPGLMGGPRTSVQTSLVVDSEQLFFDCLPDGISPECRFEARYRLSNPSDEREELVGMFYSVRASEIQIQSGELDIHRELAEEELLLIEALLLDIDSGLSPGAFMANSRFREEVGETGFSYGLNAGESGEIVVTGIINLGRPLIPSYMIPAVRMRHLVLSSSVDELVYELDYLIAPIDTWAEVGPIEVAIRLPLNFELMSGFHDRVHRYEEVAPTPRKPSWTVDEEGEFVVWRTTLSHLDGPRLRTALRRTEPEFWWGGPIIGVGGAVDDSGGFRMRLGYQVAAPSWLLYSLNLDSDFSKRLVICPTVMISTPSPAFIPFGFGIGLGVPISLLDGVHPGVRAQVDMILGPLGLVTSFDLYPGLESDDVDRLQVIMMGQVSF